MQSLEIRWFFDGPGSNATLLNWFKESGGKPEPEKRTDFYFPQSVNGEAGIKVRGGVRFNMEIKGRLEVPGDLLIDGKSLGKIEKWNKWSEKADADIHLTNIVQEKSGWIKIEKTRHLLKYECSADGSCGASYKNRIDDGCNIEITEVNINGKIRWSMGYEAFSTNLDLMNNFFWPVKATLKGEILRILHPEISFSYYDLIKKLNPSP
ncbi:MAG: hypothetical protein NTW16_08705 [Bacteroidetes bacterium]|nr:hypothetical protein [Bacteroidota bacterium]